MDGANGAPIRCHKPIHSGYRQGHKGGPDNRDRKDAYEILSSEIPSRMDDLDILKKLTNHHPLAHLYSSVRSKRSELPHIRRQVLGPVSPFWEKRFPDGRPRRSDILEISV